MSRKSKERLDILLVKRGLVSTRAKAKGVILAGEVLVEGEPVIKAGTAVSEAAQIELKAKSPYVGRGGFKLAGALERFELQVKDRICADVGACTGGFTDVLLQAGARQIFAIDVGYGQLDWKLRQNEKVVVLERTNARYLESLANPVSFVAIDVSFISLKLIFPAVKKWLLPHQPTDIVALIKPQFEAGRSQVGKGGIVRDTAVHRQVIETILEWTTKNDLGARGLMKSTIKGSDGNVEFLLWLQAGAETQIGSAEIELLLQGVDI